MISSTFRIDIVSSLCRASRLVLTTKRHRMQKRLHWRKGGELMVVDLSRAAGAVLLLVLLAGCGPVLAVDLKTGNVKFASVPTFTRDVHEGSQSQTRFTRAIILPFDNG